MNSEVAVYITFDTTESGEGEMYGGTETYENIADKSGGDMKSTFEDMDSAGSVAQWDAVAGHYHNVPNSNTMLLLVGPNNQ